jgi:uncharacterized membrane protein YidH (DUF202 family)
MNIVKVIGAILIVGGICGLAYGSFSYTDTNQVAKLGPIEINAKEKHTVNVPVWTGVGAVAVGVLLLVCGGRRD